MRWTAERRNWNRCLSGERAVEDELVILMAAGCKVFHGLSLDPHLNLHHVVVAPSGVHVIETGARPRRPGRSHPDSHEVTYDGHGLNFPDYFDTEMLDHTRDKAEALARFLRAELGEAVPVRPILTLPGWFVKSKVPDTTVRNPKNIHLVILKDAPAVLSLERVEQVAALLDKRCWTVEK
jgi:hypothetical protein